MKDISRATLKSLIFKQNIYEQDDKHLNIILVFKHFLGEKINSWKN